MADRRKGTGDNIPARGGRLRLIGGLLEWLTTRIQPNIDGSAGSSPDYVHRLSFGWLLLLFVGPLFYAYVIHFYLVGLYFASGLMLFGAAFITAAIILYQVPLGRKITAQGFKLIVIVGIFFPLILHDIDVVWIYGRLEYLGWVFLYPPLAFFLLGEAGGIVVSAVIVILLALGFVFPPLGGHLTIDAAGLAVQATLVMVCSSLIALLYEATRRQTLDRLVESELRLRQSNKELMRAEQEAIRQAAQAQEASRAKSEFLANMSHELRTPLNHVIGFTELVLEESDPGLTPANRESLGDALHSARHLLSLINDVLDTARVESGKVVLECAEVDLPQLLERSLNVVKDSAARGGIALSAEIGDIPACIVADGRKLTQVMYNLLSNAVKFTPVGGSVVLRACTRDAGESTRGTAEDPSARVFEVSIADTGIGIEAADLERLFVPFQRLEGPPGARFPGTGLGLSIARKIVELHGGRIWAESDGARKGATFRFTLPLAPHAGDR